MARIPVVGDRVKLPDWQGYHLVTNIYPSLAIGNFDNNRNWMFEDEQTKPVKADTDEEKRARLAEQVRAHQAALIQALAEFDQLGGTIHTTTDTLTGMTIVTRLDHHPQPTCVLYWEEK